jgi:hypothetical protein
MRGAYEHDTKCQDRISIDVEMGNPLADIPNVNKQPVSDGQCQRLKIVKNERQLQRTDNLSCAALAGVHD